MIYLNHICASIALILIVIFSSVTHSLAQTFSLHGPLDDNINPIITHVPFLRDAPDARSSGMGIVGIATSPDAHSIFFNAAKLAFAQHNLAFSTSYSSNFRRAISDSYLANFSGYIQVKEKNALGWSARYAPQGSFEDSQPYDYAIDLAYARKINDKLAAGITIKYVRSDLDQSHLITPVANLPGWSVAADLSVYGAQNVKLRSLRTELAWGISISNIGSKLSYYEYSPGIFIPTNLGLGTAWVIDLNKKNKLGLAFDLNKLLVPTPDTLDLDPANGFLDYHEVSAIAGIFSSFADAEFSEEINELNFSAGLEYWYAQMLAIRFGTFNEHATKGNRKFVTLGFGIRYNHVGIDYSYWIPYENQNTSRMRLSICLELDRISKS